MQIVYGVTFAKLPTGEVVIVLSTNREKRTVMVGTHRLAKLPEDKYETIRMFVDGLVFQYGTVTGDGSGQEIGKKYWYWHNPWVCEGEAWQSFDEYFPGTTSALKDDVKCKTLAS